MRVYILETPLAPPETLDDVPDRLRQLVAACREILADGEVTPQEADALRRWLSAAGWLQTQWPASAISARVQRMLNAPTKRELAELGEVLADVAKDPAFEGCESVDGLFTEPIPDITFEDATFCLTGIFYFGSRAACEDAVTCRGGLARKAVSGSTDFVVIGGICNPQWLHANAGTKIGAAQILRGEAIDWNTGKYSARRGFLPRKSPNIVRERDWVGALLRCPETLTIAGAAQRLVDLKNAKKESRIKREADFEARLDETLKLALELQELRDRAARPEV